MIELRREGGHREAEDHKGEDYEGEGREGEEWGGVNEGKITLTWLQIGRKKNLIYSRITYARTKDFPCSKRDPDLALYVMEINTSSF
jgi:hypothetical protein